MQRFYIVLLATLHFLFFFSNLAFAHHTIKVACLGSELTYEYTLPCGGKISFPTQLQILLGKEYNVMNFGLTKACVVTKGDTPYISTNEFHKAIQSNPDIVFVELGINDIRLKKNQYITQFNEGSKT